MCECFQVGGSFISEDPDCPIHGTHSHGRETRITEILEQVQNGTLTVFEGTERILEEFY